MSDPTAAHSTLMTETYGKYKGGFSFTLCNVIFWSYFLSVSVFFSLLALQPNIDCGVALSCGVWSIIRGDNYTPKHRFSVEKC